MHPTTQAHLHISSANYKPLPTFEQVQAQVSSTCEWNTKLGNVVVISLPRSRRKYEIRCATPAISNNTTHRVHFLPPIYSHIFIKPQKMPTLVMSNMIQNILEILKGHILQKRRMPKNKVTPLFFVNLAIMFGVSFLKCLSFEKGIKRHQ